MDDIGLINGAGDASLEQPTAQHQMPRRVVDIV